MPEHEFKDAIIAFAEGRPIQFKHESSWADWVHEYAPSFKGTQWRVKPKEDIVFNESLVSDGRNWSVSMNEKNLKLTFDGETFKLKSAEVI